MGVYSYHDGQLDVVASPGMTLPGVGTVETTGHCVAIGNLGHVGLEAALTDGKTALVLATPAQ